MSFAIQQSCVVSNTTSAGVRSSLRKTSGGFVIGSGTAENKMARDFMANNENYHPPLSRCIITMKAAAHNVDVLHARAVAAAGATWGVVVKQEGAMGCYREAGGGKLQAVGT